MVSILRFDTLVRKRTRRFETISYETTFAEKLKTGSFHFIILKVHLRPVASIIFEIENAVKSIMGHSQQRSTSWQSCGRCH